jgi:hypothetical protein
MSVRPSVSLPREGFSLNFTFDYFSKICQDEPRLIKTCQEQRALDTQTCVRLWHLAEFFLE